MCVSVHVCETNRSLSALKSPSGLASRGAPLLIYSSILEEFVLLLHNCEGEGTVHIVSKYYRCILELLKKMEIIKSFVVYINI